MTQVFPPTRPKRARPIRAKRILAALVAGAGVAEIASAN